MIYFNASLCLRFVVSQILAVLKAATFVHTGMLRRALLQRFDLNGAWFNSGVLSR